MPSARTTAAEATDMANASPIEIASLIRRITHTSRSRADGTPRHFPISRAHARLRSMLESTISQLRPGDGRLSGRLDGRLRQGIGRELHRLRREHGMTQAVLGDPLSKAFVSAVERGRAMPSLPALQLMVDRLGTTMSVFFDGVERLGVDPELTAAYDAGHGRGEGQDPASGGRRSA